MSNRLGKIRAVGDTFESTSNRMIKSELWTKPIGNEHSIFKVHRRGDKGFFVNRGRRYFCEVLAIVETRTGLCCAYMLDKGSSISYAGPRWWQFTYRVKIIEN